MRKALFVLALTFGFAFVLRLFSTERRARWREQAESAIEHCPPVVAMRRLEKQNQEVLALLREQNELLRLGASAERPSVRQPA